LNNRTALVTGGSRGVGRAVALELAAQGCDIALLYKSRTEGANETIALIQAQARRAFAFQIDLADARLVKSAIDSAAAALGKVDILVHAAGALGSWKSIGALSLEEWDKYLAVDLSGAFYTIHAALPHLRKAKDAAVIFLSSIAAQMCQASNVQGAAAKAGVEAMIRVLAKEEGPNGIRANVVSIGLTDTDMGRAAYEEWGPEKTKQVVSRFPLGRMGTASEIAKVVAFLASADAGYITGKVLQVDGGQFIAA
jgi:3-oxoacyl-[acyl-carrier protein] reductase